MKFYRKNLGGTESISNLVKILFILDIVLYINRLLDSD